MDESSTVANVLDWLERFPDGTLIPPACVVKQLRGAGALFDGAGTAVVPASERPPPDCWREKLWTCPATTRMTVADVAEALSWSTDKVYRYTSEKYADKQIASGYSDPRIPHRKDISGSLTFLAGELRQWVEAHEEVIAKPPAPFNERLKVVGS